MPYLQSAQSWLTQSTLLLQARPTTTRITTKYNIAHTPDSPHASSKTKARASRLAAGSEKEAAPPVRASLTLKTYDPVSGATLKYTTTKAAEVSRLIQILGRLARPMAGLPEVKEEVMADVEAGEGTGTATPVVEQSQSGKPSAPGQTQGGAGGKKGKKKGKK